MAIDAMYLNTLKPEKRLLHFLIETISGGVEFQKATIFTSTNKQMKTYFLLPNMYKNFLYIFIVIV